MTWWRPLTGGDPRARAAELAAGGDLAALEATVGRARRGRALELAACWAQEAVLRGADLEASEPVRALRERLRCANHPLAWLPLRREPLEHSSLAPGVGAEEPATAAERRLPDSALPPVIDPRFRRADDPAGDLPTPEAPPWARTEPIEVSDPEGSAWARFAGAARGLVDDPARLQIRELCYGQPLGRPVGKWWSGDAPPPGVPMLGLEALDLVGPRDALEALFRAAMHDPLLERGIDWPAGWPGPFRPYARLAAWISLGALAGAVPSASPSEVTAEARRAEWRRFEPEWGDAARRGFGLGLLAIRSDRRSLAVLAASG